MNHPHICLGALLAASLGAGAASAADAILATDLPPAHIVSVNGIEPLMACITEGTQGAITFNYFPSGQLVKRNEGVSALQKGLAQFAFSTLAHETAALPLQGLTMLPGISDSALHTVEAWRRTVDGGGALGQEMSKAKIRPVILNAMPPYQIMGQHEYADLDDWKGKKIRTTGSSLNFMVESIGGVPIEMSGNEMYTALQRGTVDASILSFSSVKSYSVQEVVKSMSANASFGTSTQILSVSSDYYDSLPAEHQKVIDDCGHRIERDLAAFLDNSENGFRQEFAGMGIEIYELSPEQIAAFSGAVESVEKDFVTRLSGRDLPAQQALDEFKAAMQQ